jgi:hypothetical protein
MWTAWSVFQERGQPGSRDPAEVMIVFLFLFLLGVAVPVAVAGIVTWFTSR